MHLEIKISDKLTDNEWRNIEIFKKKAAELRETAILEQGSNIRTSIKYERGKGLQISSALPREDYLKPLFMAFRFFFLNDEPSNFYRVVNILKKYTRNEHLNKRMDRLKDQWSGALLYVFF
jgi:hypothetical protein